MLKKNILSILVALLITYLSLTPGSTFDKVPMINIPYFDKIVHFIMYFSLMSVIIFENRKRIKDRWILILISLIPVCFGILMEILQSLLTTSRTGSLYDIVFNCAGVLCSVLICLYIKLIRRQLII